MTDAVRGSRGEGDRIVIVNGLPGSGKSTLAVRMADELGLPLIAKDLIKEVLFDFPEVRASAGPASIAVMYALAGAMGSVVLDSPFDPTLARADLEQLGRPVLEVYCSCPPLLAIERFEARKADGRHPMHGPWSSSGDRPVAMGPVLEVDTTRAVDLDAVLGWLHRHGLVR